VGLWGYAYITSQIPSEHEVPDTSWIGGGLWAALETAFGRLLKLLGGVQRAQRKVSEVLLMAQSPGVVSAWPHGFCTRATLLPALEPRPIWIGGGPCGDAAGAFAPRGLARSPTPV